MRKFLNKKTGSVIIVGALVVGLVGAHLFSNSLSSSAEDKVMTAKERLQAKRDEAQSNAYSIDTDASLNQTVRAIITLEADSVAESVSKATDVSNYTSKLQSKEEKIIKNQKDIIKDVEKLTDNKVINQTGYLVNSFSIDAKRSEIKKIAKMDGVEKVYESVLYTPCMETAIDEGNVTAQLESEEYGYTGEGVVIAIVDTGVNYQHQDMKLDEGVKTKYTKEEWKEKIELLGYGKYMSDKVPFGYNYTTGINDCLNAASFHGYHVSGIAAGNGKINGVARNAQVLGLNVFGDGFGASSDAIVKGIEDAVKLGADIINMSLGSDKSIVTDENYIQAAVENASKDGVICCISAGNSGTSAGNEEPNNLMNMKDTAMIGSPSVTRSSLSVASADNIVNPLEIANDETANNLITENNNTTDLTQMDINMSSFSSWGPTNELGIKPEITAPGGNIKAALDGEDNYEVYSGTSMSSPFVAGSQAVLLNAIQARGLDISGEKLAKFMKNSLMNTADVIIDETINAPYPVRNQGAGMVDVYGAVDNEVIVTCKDEAKVELGEIEGTTTFDMVLTNYGKETCVYALNNSQIYTDYTINTKDENGINGEYGIKPVEGANITYSMNRVEVPAGGSVTVTATVNIPANYENNSFVEAFVKLEGEGVQSLGLPVLGFYGEWDGEPIIDKSAYDEGESMLDKATMLIPVKGGSHLASNSEKGEEILGLEWEKVNELENVDNNLANTCNIRNGIYVNDKIQDEIIQNHKDKATQNNKNQNKTTQKIKNSQTKTDEENIEEKMNEYIPPTIEEGVELEIKDNDDNRAYYEFNVAEDGYYTFDFKEMGLTNIIIGQRIMSGQEMIDYSIILNITEYGSVSRELKLRKDAKYDIQFICQDSINTDTICKAKFYKTTEENAYTLQPKFNGETVAFSPNEDNVKDSVMPKFALYRCAKELKIKVLDSEFNTIRTIANRQDEARMPYRFIGGEYYSSYVSDGSDDGIVDWDGKVYNKQTGEYEYAKPGQYYIQAEAKITKDAIPQVITMPIKIDNEAPKVNEFEVNKIEGNTVVEFKVEDNLAMNSNFYVDIEESRNNTFTYSRKYAETDVNEDGNYVVNLGNIGKANITFLVEDMAGNQVYKEYDYKGNDSDEDIDIDLSDGEEYNLCQGVNIVPILEEGAYFSSYDGKLCFEGECSNDITITINGNEATYSEDAILHTMEEGKHFDISVPITNGTTMQDLNVIVCKSGTEIFNKIFNVFVDVKPVSIELIKTEDMIDHKAYDEGYNNVVLLKESVEGKSYTMQFKVEGYTTENMDTFLRVYHYDEEYNIVDNTPKYEGDGIYTFQVQSMEELTHISTEIIYGDNCISKTYLLTANESIFKEKCNEWEMYFDTNIYSIGNVDKTILNEDGTFTVTGKTIVMPEEVLVNGHKVEVNQVNSDKFEFAYNVPIKKGSNFVNIEVTIHGKKLTRGTVLVYDEITLKLDDSIKEVDGVVNTDKERFNLVGTIKSYTNVASIEVNGDNLYNASDTKTAPEDKPFEKKFDYNIKLGKGVNKITLVAKTIAGEEVVKVITVNYN